MATGHSGAWELFELAKKRPEWLKSPILRPHTWRQFAYTKKRVFAESSADQQFFSMK
jgi:hypothetical protein